MSINIHRHVVGSEFETALAADVNAALASSPTATDEEKEMLRGAADLVFQSTRGGVGEDHAVEYAISGSIGENSDNRSLNVSMRVIRVRNARGTARRELGPPWTPPKDGVHSKSRAEREGRSAADTGSSGSAGTSSTPSTTRADKS